MNENPFFPLTDEIDHQILMHRDAHFGGNFEIMLDYYQQEGKGAMPDFSLERIEDLLELEKQAKNDLSQLVLTPEEKEKVRKAKKLYLALRDIYEYPKQSLVSCLIADLILSEEDVPLQEVEALVAQKEKAVPALIQLLASEDFHDPLFPSYGKAPADAATCLGRIGDERAIAPLFTALRTDDFFEEEAILSAFRHMGPKAVPFLLSVLKRKPITHDNEQAALVLLEWKDDPQVVEAFAEMCKEEQGKRIIDYVNSLCL